MKKNIYFLFTLFFTLFFAPQLESFSSSHLFEQLLNDIKLYKLDSQGDPYLHAGDLYEHSIWTHNALLQIVRSDLAYAQQLNLTQREIDILALAALLHDIGKAGRKELFDRTHPKLFYDIVKNDQGAVEKIVYYQDRQEHPVICFAYTLKTLIEDESTRSHLPDYQLIDRQSGKLTPFDLKKMFQELGVTNDEQKVIAILLGIHYEFGNFKHGKLSAEQFLAFLEQLVVQTGYNGGQLDEKIVRLSILINAADVKGLMPVDAQPSALFESGISCAATHHPTKFDDTFAQLGFACTDCCSSIPLAVEKMNELIAYFKSQYGQQTAEQPTYAFA